jgi:hypothetical protein
VDGADHPLRFTLLIEVNLSLPVHNPLLAVRTYYAVLKS